jgi:hypothetical protein
MTQPIIHDPLRSERIASFRTFVEFLEQNPTAPVPSATQHHHLDNGQDDELQAENLALVRDLAAKLGVGTDEHLDDRTVLRIKVAPHLWYELFAWHRSGRGLVGEVERLRGEVARLNARIAKLDEQATGDPTGLTYSREQDDPTPVSPARGGPVHTGGVVAGGQLVDETPAEHYEASIRTGPTGIGDSGATCACGTDVGGFDTVAEAQKQLAFHIEAATSPTGLTPAADLSRGPLAGTSPVVTYFSFGHGQTDPGTGQKLIDHYVTVVAPTYEECREAMLASRFGHNWSWDYLAGRAKTTEAVSQWTEHEVIVAPGTDQELAKSALKAAGDLLFVVPVSESR